MFYRFQYASPIGKLTLVISDHGLHGLWMEDQKYFASGFHGQLLPGENHPMFAPVRNWLDAYFYGNNPGIPDFPLVPQGSAFRQTVWSALLQIPYGQAATYGQIAKMIGCRSAQAVGGAIGHNPISIIIPCHRVLGSDGSLTGYAGGKARKLWLLEHEGISVQLRNFAGK